MSEDTHFAMISEWMVNGNINDFVRAHPAADRLGLVGRSIKSHRLYPRFTKARITRLAEGRL